MEEKITGLSLIKIRVEEFIFNDLPSDIPSPIDQSNLLVGMDVNFHPWPNKNVFTVYHRYKYQYRLEQGILPVLDFAASYDFYIPELNNISTQVDAQKFKISEDLMNKIVGTAIDTSRGIIYTRTVGSKINDFYVPITNIPAFLKSLGKQKDIPMQE